MQSGILTVHPVSFVFASLLAPTYAEDSDPQPDIRVGVITQQDGLHMR